MLDRQQIRHLMTTGDIVIEQFNEDDLQVNSYDITLGGWFVRFKELGYENRILCDEGTPFAQDLYFVAFYEHEFVIRPHEKVLCHTDEFIGTTAKAVPGLATKSTIARVGLDVCGSAGFGDVGYYNRWTMELKNDTPNSIVVPVGTKIGQAYFSPIPEEHRPTGILPAVSGLCSGTYDGAYNLDKPGTYKEMLDKWSPYDMLPKMIRRHYD